MVEDEGRRGWCGMHSRHHGSQWRLRQLRWLRRAKAAGTGLGEQRTARPGRPDTGRPDAVCVLQPLEGRDLRHTDMFGRAVDSVPYIVAVPKPLANSDANVDTDTTTIDHTHCATNRGAYG